MNKKLLYVLLLIMVTITFTFAKPNNKEPKPGQYLANYELPSKMKIISQSCTMINLFISAIDLSNNEYIILVYSHGGVNSYLENVIRTGVSLDPKDQKMVMGTDAPFQTNN